MKFFFLILAKPPLLEHSAVFPKTRPKNEFGRFLGNFELSFLGITFSKQATFTQNKLFFITFSIKSFSQKQHFKISPCRRAKRFLLERAIFFILFPLCRSRPTPWWSSAKCYESSLFLQGWGYPKDKKWPPANLRRDGGRSFFTMSEAKRLCPLQEKSLCPTTKYDSSNQCWST